MIKDLIGKIQTTTGQNAVVKDPPKATEIDPAKEQTPDQIIQQMGLEFDIPMNSVQTPASTIPAQESVSMQGTQMKFISS